jgi:hypothetical protein
LALSYPLKSKRPQGHFSLIIKEKLSPSWHQNSFFS